MAGQLCTLWSLCSSDPDAVSISEGQRSVVTLPFQIRLEILLASPPGRAHGPENISLHVVVSQQLPVGHVPLEINRVCGLSQKKIYALGLSVGSSVTAWEYE